MQTRSTRQDSKSCSLECDDEANWKRSRAIDDFDAERDASWDFNRIEPEGWDISFLVFV